MDFVDDNIQKVQVQPEDQVYARNEDIKVYGKLVSMSTENVVADSEQIWDETLKKNQSEINSQTQSKFGEYLPLAGGNINGNLNVDGTVGLTGPLTLDDGNNAAHFTPTSIELSMSNDSVDTHVTAKTINTNEVLLVQSKAHGTQTVDTSITPGLIRLHQTPGGSKHVTTIQPTGIRSSMFQLTDGTDQDVLLGDGSTTNRLIKDVTAGAIQSEYNFNFVTTGNVNKFVTINAATSTTAGVMTAADKAKLDDIENTYLPLSGGTLTGTLNIDFTEGIRITEYDLSPRNTYIGNGSIKIEQLDGDTSNIISKTEINSDSIITTNATVADKVKANGFLANNNGNGNTAWTTNGGSINLINLLKNAAIYVAGGFELAESGIDNTTVVDSPNSIIFDNGTKRFLARKGMICYTHWKADISKNIAPPSRYGIETDNGVFPFNNQMYKFSTYDDIFIATCSNGTCSMKKLTL